MPLSYRLVCCFFSLCTWGTVALGQKADSLRGRLAVLAKERQTHMLKDTDYLRAVDSIAPFLEQEDSLPEWLSTYRDIAFADARPGRHKAYYYTYLALNAYNTKKLGSAIYYSEKNNDERINAGLFERGGLSHSDMFAIVVYYNNHDYVRAEQKYQRLAAALHGMPGRAAAGKLSGEQAFVALSILQVAVFSYGKTADRVKMKDASSTARALLASLMTPGSGFTGSASFLPPYAKYRSEFEYLDHSIGFEERSFAHDPKAAPLLYAAIEDVRDTTFPEGMRADYIAGLYSLAVEYYTDLHKTDSVSHYLALLRGIGANARESTADSVFLIASDGYLLGEEGHYEQAYRQLKNAYRLRDSAFYLVASDRDNNLYALAEADNAHAEMFRSEEKKRAAERFNLYLFFLLSLLVLAGIVTWSVSRWRQRQRLLNLKLGLARNFHDAVGPMLLYANALVKKQMDDPSTDRLAELKTHIGRIMDEVRGIAYDLKSNSLYTVGDLARESALLLEKLGDAAGIASNMKTENEDRLLSHMQHTHLSHIIRELIANSVKHAACHRISLELKAMGPELRLRYSDDGKGFDPGAPKTGIGLQNIRERVDVLNGILELNNGWPDGYFIGISVPLPMSTGGGAGVHGVVGEAAAGT